MNKAGNIIGMIAGMMIIASAFLPWVTISEGGSDRTLTGIDLDGLYVIAAGFIFLITLPFAPKNRFWQFPAVVCSGFCIIMSLSVLQSAETNQAAIGLWVLLISGVTAGLSLVMIKNKTVRS